MTSCVHSGCKEEATHNPLLCCPPVDRVCKDLEMFFSLELCKRHAKTFDIQAFINHPSPTGTGTNAVLFEFAFKPHNTKPDFLHAYVRPLRIGAPETEKLKRIMGLKADADKPVPPAG